MGCGKLENYHSEFGKYLVKPTAVNAMYFEVFHLADRHTHPTQKMHHVILRTIAYVFRQPWKGPALKLEKTGERRDISQEIEILAFLDVSNNFQHLSKNHGRHDCVSLLGQFFEGNFLQKVMCVTS